MESNLSDIQDFFVRIKSFESDYWQSSFKRNETNFQSFMLRYREFNKAQRNLLKQETPYYNLFDVLNIKHRETKLHTPFIRHLLDPQANHEQGALFLNSFLNQVLGLEYRYEQMDSFLLSEEYVMSDGRMDLLIRFKWHGSSCAIVIENKIYARDQELQLERYYHYVREELNLENDCVTLVYLTVDGSKPNSQAITPSLANKLYDKRVLKNIGYKADIYHWLQSHLQDVPSDLVKYTLRQYLLTLEYL